MELIRIALCYNNLLPIAKVLAEKAYSKLANTHYWRNGMYNLAGE